jgi:hypothetical protein
MYPEVAIGLRRIQVPSSGNRKDRGRVFAKLLEHVEREALAGFGFDGKLCVPGEWIDSEDLPEHPAILECAGPLGEWKRGKQRAMLWILWRLDRAAWEWIEVARAQAIGWEWALVLREPAWRCLNPDPGLYDVIEKGNTLALAIMAAIDGHLKDEDYNLQASVLSLIHERICGRMVASK